MRRNVFAARFWFAPGVEVFSGRVVTRPLYLRVRFNVYMSELPVAWRAPTVEEAARSPIVHVVEFTLSDWSETGDVAHYELTNGPPAGWRWYVVGGVVRAERTSSGRRRAK
jgi:hypothetical protein